MFKILVPTHGKEPATFKDLIQSILMQDHLMNLECIFLEDTIDPCFKKQILSLESIFKFEANKTKDKSYALKNICTYLDSLKEDCIIGILDCDDLLWGKNCISNIISLYKQGYDCVWTANRMNGTGINFSAPLNQNVSPYSHPWVSSHFKTFQLSDYKSVNAKNFIDREGKWFTSCYDQALMLPILHNILKRNGTTKYLDKVHYIYNGSINIDNNSKYRISQLNNESFIRERGYVQ